MADKRGLKTCPRCGDEYTDYPSLSRRDNETDICPKCGTAEAFEDAGFRDTYEGKPYWNEETVKRNMEEINKPIGEASGG